MNKDFSGKNLQGRSFKDNEDLSGAVFSYADIRGVDFTGATLTGANFSHAKAGIKPIAGIYLFILSVCLLFALGFIASASGAYTITVNQNFILNEIIQMYLSDAVGLILFAIFSTIIIRKGLVSGVGSIVAIILVGAVVAVVSARVGVFIKIAKILSQVVSAGLAQAAAADATALVAATTFVMITAAISQRAAVIVGVLGMMGALIAATFSAFAAAGLGAGITSALITVAGALLSILLAKRAKEGDEKQALIHNVAIHLAARRGTCFVKANLTDANFTHAIIKNTNFQTADLMRVCWYKAKGMDFALLEDTYLYFKDAEVRKLLVTGEGENKIFDYRDFRGINLSGANLSHSSFICTNFYQANLQSTDLSDANLVRTQLEQASLIYATLTGACIEDWVITRSTKLDEITCKRIFMKLENGAKCDQRPTTGKFRDGEFILFVQSILHTIELYHERDLDPRAAVFVLKSLADKYNEPLEIVNVGKADNGAIILRLKISEWIDREQIKEEYQNLYSNVLTLSMQDPAKLLLQENTQIIANYLEEFRKRAVNNYNIEIQNNHGVIQNVQNSQVDCNLLVQGNNNQLAMADNKQAQLTKLIQILTKIETITYNSQLSSETKEELIERILQESRTHYELSS